MARTTLGILDGARFDQTERILGINDDSAESSGYCPMLQIPAPSLQWELHSTNRPVKFYLGVHIILFGKEDSEGSDYFLCLGDQINNLVFISAIVTDTNGLPKHLLCLREKSFMRWIFPVDSEVSEVPPLDAWEPHNPEKFSKTNVKPGHLPKIHINNEGLFREKVVTIVSHLSSNKYNDQYNFIFKFELHDGTASSSIQGVDDGEKFDEEQSNDDEDKFVDEASAGENQEDNKDNSSSYLTPQEKAKKTRAANKLRVKEYHQPSRGSTRKPPIDMNVLLLKVQQQGNSKGKNGGQGNKKTSSRSTRQPKNDEKTRCHSKKDPLDDPPDDPPAAKKRKLN